MRKNISTLVFLLFLTIVTAQRITSTPWQNGADRERGHMNNVYETLKLKKISNKFKSVNQNLKKTIDNSRKRKFNTSLPLYNGINLAWINYARDTGVHPENDSLSFRPDLEAFGVAMDTVVSKGGNAVRWWFHTNGSTSPVFDENQKVKESPGFIKEDIKSILDLAHSKGLKLQICLWSFDMLKDQWGVDVNANHKLLTEDDYTDAYINNELIPLVNFIGNHPGLLAWEIFNEPEGMTNRYASHWPGFLKKVTMLDIQKFVNKTTGAIRKAQSSVKITNGAIGLLTNMEDEAKGYWNAYSDANLIAAGEDEDGYLDFYNAHFYAWMRSDGSPIHHKFDPTKIDKDLVIGEYYPDKLILEGEEDTEASDLGTRIIDNDWAGSLVWSWTDRSSEQERDTMSVLIEKVKVAIDYKNLGIDARDNDYALEAEKALLTGNTNIFNGTNASGNSYVELLSNPSSIAFSIDNVEKEGTYRVEFIARSHNGNMDDGNKIQLITASGNNKTEEIEFGASDVWKSNASYLYLAKGDNTITLEGSWGYTNIDRIIIRDLEVSKPSKLTHANAGEDIEVTENLEGLAEVSLNGSESYTDEGSVITNYSWMIDGEEIATGVNPSVSFEVGVHKIRLVVINDDGNKDTDEVIVTVKEQVVKLAHANAGEDIEVTESLEGFSEVTLDGSESYTDEGSVITSYSWEIDGEEIATGVNPIVSFEVGIHKIMLIVTNDDGNKDTDEVTVIVKEKVDENPETIYEAEDAILTKVTVGFDSQASNGRYAYMKGDRGKVEWRVNVPEDGVYSINIKYAIPFGVKEQWLDVNRTHIGVVRFDGSNDGWNNKEIRLNLMAGENKIIFTAYWGYMYFDFISLKQNLIVSKVDFSSFNTKDEMLRNDFNMYPNPTQDKLNINGVAVGDVITVCNFAGRVVMKLKTTQPNQHVDVSKLQAGTYMIHISGKRTKRFIKK